MSAAEQHDGPTFVIPLIAAGSRPRPAHLSPSRRAGLMSAKSLVLTAGVALVVVLGYEHFKSGKHPQLRRAV